MLRTLPLGELLIVGFPGPTISTELAEFAATHGLGGVILFDYDCTSKSYGRNVVSPDQVRDLCHAVHQLPSRPLVTIDQEGGKVRRLKESLGFAPLPSAQAMANLSSTDQDDLMLRACQEMADLGIDMDLAPVLDVAYNPQSPGLGAAERCYSTRASEVKSYAERFCSAATKARLALCLKHYPGLGSAEVDSHADFTVLKHVPEEQTQLFLDLAPRCPGNAILISHGVVPQWDARTPTTMCGPVLSGLRAMLQHTVFISDDMQMQGLLKTRALAQACVDGLAAGLDMLIIGDNLIRLKSNELQEIIDAISDRAARDKIFRASLNLKLTRIERLKSQCRNQSF